MQKFVKMLLKFDKISAKSSQIFSKFVKIFSKYILGLASEGERVVAGVGR